MSYNYYYLAQYTGRHPDLVISPAGNTKMAYIIQCFEKMGMYLNVFSTAETKTKRFCHPKTEYYEGYQVKYIASFLTGIHFLNRLAKAFQRWQILSFLKKKKANDVVVIYHNTPYLKLINKIQCEKKEKSPRFEVLNQGRFTNGRGYDITIRACQYITDYPQIAFAVRGFGDLDTFLREEAAKIENREQFIMYPPVDTKDLISYASMSYVGIAITEPVCLNYRLSVSNKIFEYAAAGLPVIMSDIPEHRYLNEKYNFGLIIMDNSPKCLAEAAITLYKNQELYAKLSSNAYKMSQELNWENEFEKLLLAEKRIMKEKKNND